MSGRTVLLLVAGIIAAFTAISVRNRLSQSPAPEAVQTSHIIVAKHDLSPGSFVQGAQDLDWGAIPASEPSVVAGDNSKPEDNPPKENYLHEGAVKLSDFNGAVVRRQLRAGEPVPQSALMKSGEGGFMSAVLNPGMRAVSIAVNATSGNAGFISPGDHVDLIVTHRVKTQSNGPVSEESVVSETFVHDVRVVAVDQMLDNPENKAILAKTVTVEVTPRQAEQVSVAAEMGKIAVTLRSLAGAPPPKPVAKGNPDDPAHVLADLYGETAREPVNDNNYTRDSDLSELLGHKSTVAPRVQVIRGDQIQNMEFYRDAK